MWAKTNRYRHILLAKRDYYKQWAGNKTYHLVKDKNRKQVDTGIWKKTLLECSHLCSATWILSKACDSLDMLSTTLKSVVHLWPAIISSSTNANLGFRTETLARLPMGLLPFTETWPGCGHNKQCCCGVSVACLHTQSCPNLCLICAPE